MSEDANNVTCEEFQKELPELLGCGVDWTNHPHAKACENCCGFLRELYRIAEGAGDQRFRSDDFGSDDWSEST